MTEIIAGVLYTRRQPDPGWGEAVALADELLQQAADGSRTAEAAAALFDMLLGVDQEQGETLRYYGLGHLACHVYQSLERSAVHDHAVEALGQGLYAHAQGKLFPYHIVKEVVPEFFPQLAGQADEKLAPGIRFVNDALNGVNEFRKSMRRHPPGSWLAAEGHRKRQIELLQAGGSAAEMLGREALLGASLPLFRQVLVQRQIYLLKEYERTHGERRDQMTVAEIIAEGIDALSLEKIAAKAATLRLDEFKEGVAYRTFLQTTAEGVIVFRDDFKAPAKTLPSPDENEARHTARETNHAGRLVCVATYVADMIPKAMRLLVQGVARADELANAA